MIINEGKPERILIRPIWKCDDKYVFLLLGEIELAKVEIINKEQSRVMHVCGKTGMRVVGTLNSTLHFIKAVIVDILGKEFM